MATYIYIDDTGNAQHRSGFKYDTSRSASWCAIILNERQYDSALEFMNHMSDKFLKPLEADEFHFADILSGKGIYRNFNNRFDIFRSFSRFSALEQYVVILQSFGEDDYKRNKLEKTNTAIDGFKLHSYSDFALFILLYRIKEYLNSNPSYTKPYKIVVDEGRYKNNSYQDCLMFGELLEDRKILYKSSKEEKLLQLADFTAYTLNRCTWLNMKDVLSKYDIEFLQIASEADFNAPFLRKMYLSIDSNRRQIYENLLDIANKKNQALSRENLDDFVKKLIN